MTTLRALWRDHKLLLLGFVLAALVTLMLCVRLVVLTVYFAHHRDMTLEGWMPLGYVARSYDVDPAVLKPVIGGLDGINRHSSIAEIAAKQHRPVAEVEQDILAAIQARRADK